MLVCSDREKSVTNQSCRDNATFFYAAKICSVVAVQSDLSQHLGRTSRACENIITEFASGTQIKDENKGHLNQAQPTLTVVHVAWNII